MRNEQEQTLETRADQVQRRCRAFHRANPEVWTTFQRLADRAREAGLRRYSWRAVFEAIRWEESIGFRTRDRVRLNDKFGPLYARAYMASRPDRAEFFRTARRTTQDRLTTRDDDDDLDGEVAAFGPLEPDEELERWVRATFELDP